MKAEKRAALFVEVFNRADGWEKWGSPRLVDNIASVIRSAENDALERAAKYLGSPSLSTDNEDQAHGFRLGLESAAMSVRALKHEEP